MDKTSPESCDRLRQAIFQEIDLLESSVRALKSCHNELAPISHLPSDVLSAIFSLLSFSAWNEGSGLLAWIHVAHVCRQWRETALNHPRFWSHINLTKLTPVGGAEILSRAKMAPLHLEVDHTELGFEVYERQIDAHISHIRHLKINANKYFLSNVVKRLVPPPPTLESLSLSHELDIDSVVYGSKILDDLFNCTAPNLTSLTLYECHFGWKSPLLKGLRTLDILHMPSTAMPELDDWLDALDEMPQLKELYLQHATPKTRPANRLVSRTVTLPSLTHFHINNAAMDCELALARLLLPTLTWLRVDVGSHDKEGEDVKQLIPYVARNAHVLQDNEPFRSVLVAGERTRTEVLTWTTPGVDVKVCGPDSLNDMSRSARLTFTAIGHTWNYGVDTAIFDTLLTLLPMNSVLTFTAENRTRLNKEVWLRHSPRMPLLEQASLVASAVRAFVEMLAEDIPLDSDGPRLPMLTKLILLDVDLSAMRMDHLRNVLMERVEQGVPLDYLDLRTCCVGNCATQLLAEIVVDVQGPPLARGPPIETLKIPGGYRGHYNKVGFDNCWVSWHGNSDKGKGEGGEDE